MAGGVLFNGKKSRYALAVLVFPTHGVTRSLGSDHHNVHISGGLDQLEADVEAVGKAQHLAGAQVGSDLLLVDVLLEFIGQQHHDPVRFGGGVGNVENLKTVSLGLVRRAASFIKTNHHVHATVFEVQCVGMALGAITDDRDGLAVQQTEIGVGVVEELCHPEAGLRSCAMHELTQRPNLLIRLRLGGRSRGRSGRTPWLPLRSGSSRGRCPFRSSRNSGRSCRRGSG